jgi:hypothetical protein
MILPSAHTRNYRLPRVTGDPEHHRGSAINVSATIIRVVAMTIFYLIASDLYA